MKYAWMGINHARKINNSYQIAEFFYSLGNSQYYANRKDSAIYYYEQSFEMLKHAKKDDVGNKNYIEYLKLKLFHSIGTINYTYGKFDVALENYFNALDIAEKIKDYEETSSIYLDIANTYDNMLNHSQTEIYYLKAEKLNRELKDSVGLADTYQGLCSVLITK